MRGFRILCFNPKRFYSRLVNGLLDQSNYTIRKSAHRLPTVLAYSLTLPNFIRLSRHCRIPTTAPPCNAKIMHGRTQAVAIGVCVILMMISSNKMLPR